jgi:ABC-type molybdenum transport system ATPase subunit/photorepair protein PhrA
VSSNTSNDWPGCWKSKADKDRRPQPLGAGDLPAAASQGVPFTLLAMKDLVNVNRIVGNQVLKFAPNGVTVIYGDNGSGKSGYSRVLTPFWTRLGRTQAKI